MRSNIVNMGADASSLAFIQMVKESSNNAGSAG
jgi:hypothetical protein